MNKQTNKQQKVYAQCVSCKLLIGFTNPTINGYMGEFPVTRTNDCSGKPFRFLDITTLARPVCYVN